MGTWNNKKCLKCNKPLTDERYAENNGYCGSCKNKPESEVQKKQPRYKEQHTGGYYDYANVNCPRCGDKLYWITLFYKNGGNSWKALECLKCHSNYLNLERVEEVEDELANK